MKKRALIYGAGHNFIQQYDTISLLYQIVGVIDASKEKTGGEIFGFSIKGLEGDQLKNSDFDRIIVTPTKNEGIVDCLMGYGIEREKILLLSEMYNEEYRGSRMHIAVVFYGGMGDFLIGKNWLCRIVNKYALSEERWDVCFESGDWNRGREIFESCEFVENILCEDCLVTGAGNYDLILRFYIFPYVQSFSDIVIVKNNELFFDYILALYAFGLKNYCVGFCYNPHFFKTIRNIMHLFPDRQYHNYCDIFGDLKMGDNFVYEFLIKGDENKFLRKNGLLNKAFITINTGRHIGYKEVVGTRAWSRQKWNDLAVAVKKRFPDIITVQVGEKMSEEDDIEADVRLNGKTNLDEVGILMKHAAVHVDYDGGLVHVRHILNGGPSVVLFGSTAVERHSYQENVGIRTDVCPDACEWTTGRWIYDCPRGLAEPECMSSIEPWDVCDKIAEVLMPAKEGGQ